MRFLTLDERVKLEHLIIAMVRAQRSLSEIDRLREALDLSPEYFEMFTERITEEQQDVKEEILFNNDHSCTLF